MYWLNVKIGNLFHKGAFWEVNIVIIFQEVVYIDSAPANKAAKNVKCIHDGIALFFSAGFEWRKKLPWAPKATPVPMLT